MALAEAKSLVSRNGASHMSRRKFVNGMLRHSKINRLRQVRLTFEGIEELADSIAADGGLIHPPTVAVFTPRQAKRYVEALNQVWKTSHSWKNLVVDDDGLIKILVAGERRYRACQILLESGCSDCRERYRSLKPQQCYLRHIKFIKTEGLPSDSIEVRLMTSPTVQEALDVQFSENTGRQPPKDEVAQGYDCYYRYLKIKHGGSYPISKFVKKVGRTVQAVKDALAFCKLPEEFQLLVRPWNAKDPDTANYQRRGDEFGLKSKRAYLRYGHCVQLASLIEYWEEVDQPIDLDVLSGFVHQIVYDDLPVEKLSERVTNHIQTLKNGQEDLFDLMEMTQLRLDGQNNRRLAFELKRALTLSEGVRHVKLVADARQQRILGEPDSLYATGCPINTIERLASAIEATLPDLQQIPVVRDRLSKPRAKRITHVCSKAKDKVVCAKETIPEAGSGLNGTDG